MHRNEMKGLEIENKIAFIYSISSNVEQIWENS